MRVAIKIADILDVSPLIRSDQPRGEYLIFNGDAVDPTEDPNYRMMFCCTDVEQSVDIAWESNR